jgi:hypothetical protein
MSESNAGYVSTPIKAKKRIIEYTPQQKPPYHNPKSATNKGTDNQKTNANMIRVSKYSSNAAQFTKKRSTRKYSPLSCQVILNEMKVEEQKSNNLSDDIDEYCNVKVCKSTKNIAVSKKRASGVNVPLFQCETKPVFKNQSDWNALISMNSMPIAPSVCDYKLQNKEYIIYTYLELH